jgi:hypothetical protein
MSVCKRGAGLLWFEAVADGGRRKASARQLWIHDGNLSDFSKAAGFIHKECKKGVRRRLFTSLHNAADSFGKVQQASRKACAGNSL